jgi:hypothetical protein
MNQPELITLQMLNGRSLEATVSVGTKAVIVTTAFGQTSFNPVSVREVCLRLLAIMDGQP